MDKIEKFISSAASDINFSIDEESGVTVIKIIDRGTKDVIRQIPSEEMLEISRALDRLQGLFIKNKA
ncbi:MAG: flagellar protein FlaG [Candidatus Accumulibacter sp.]|nr:flagellar protein FlaG [Accumulibacter sp.]